MLLFTYWKKKKKQMYIQALPEYQLFWLEEQNLIS